LPWVFNELVHLKLIQCPITNFYAIDRKQIGLKLTVLEIHVYINMCGLNLPHCMKCNALLKQQKFFAFSCFYTSTSHQINSCKCSNHFSYLCNYWMNLA